VLVGLIHNAIATTPLEVVVTSSKPLDVNLLELARVLAKSFVSLLPSGKALRYTWVVEASTRDRISKAPGVCGGRACIEGHRVRVLDIVAWHEHQGMSPDEIVSQVPSLTLADVHAALAYYFEHLEEIREEMRAERAEAEAVRRAHPSLVEAQLRREKVDATP